MCANSILQWVQDKLASKAIKGIVGSNSYCDGVARGLLRSAEKEVEAEKQRVLEEERARIAAAVKAEAVSIS